MSLRARPVRSVSFAIWFILASSLLGRSSIGQNVSNDSAQSSAGALNALSEADVKRVEELNETIDKLWRAGKFAEAVGPAQQVLAVFEKRVGPNHWYTANARRAAQTIQTAIGLPQEARRELASVPALEQQASEDYENAKYAETETLRRKVLAIRVRWLGEDHPDTASSYNELGEVLGDDGRLTESEAMHKRAAGIRLKALGDRHPETASSYNDLGVVLRDQGKLNESESMHQRAVPIFLKAVGYAHPATATAYNNLAVVLCDQGKLAEAEGMHRRALAIRLATRGDSHLETIHSYNNLAVVLHAQGKLAESATMHRRALRIKLKTRGNGHPSTATSYSNLAEVLRDQEKLAQAEAMNRRALAIRVKALGEGHAETTTSYNNLALVVGAQGRLAEAETMHRRELEFSRKTLGEEHLQTAQSHSNLAAVLGDQGKMAEAEMGHRRALAIRLKALGDGHPDTATSYLFLGQTLDRLGRANEALDSLTAAVRVFEHARLRGVKGLESALLGEQNPSPILAVALASTGRSRDAWERWEQGLARGVFDEVAGRALRPVTPDERSIESDLQSRSQNVDEQISRLVGRNRLTPREEKRLDELRREESEIRRRFLDLQQVLERKYGALAGQSVTLEEARSALSEGTAVIGWVDTKLHHAACILRRTGDPVWVTIPGRGKDGVWDKEDESLARRARDALEAHASESEWRPLVEALSRQRLRPLEMHLNGVRRVIVVTSPGLAGVPVEVLLAIRTGTGEPGPVVAYCPSASMFVHLAHTAKSADRPATLLALGDPAYPVAKPDKESTPPPPDQGLRVATIEPNGIADLFGIKIGDILLEYDGKRLEKVGDLRVAATDGGPKAVTLKLWSDGEVRPIEVAVGPLGIGFGQMDVAQPRRADNSVSRDASGGFWDPLPGTRQEVEAIAGLFPAGDVTVIMGDKARESVLQELARSDKLKGFRFLHFAAHGRDDPRSAYRTALILASERDHSDDTIAQDTDGEITAEQIARTWELDADMVVLSACQSALGRVVAGEGYLGFTQPLLAKGARSLVLSLWKVDDRATAMLMKRFYQNLLGKRADGKDSMPKAEALGEAKLWLRTQSAENASATRGSPRKSLKGEPHRVVSSFDDPYYWAGFVLIGDPN
jgi:tetratricopeptide (TPR) repeat protein